MAPGQHHVKLGRTLEADDDAKTLAQGRVAAKMLARGLDISENYYGKLIAYSLRSI